MSVRQLDLDLLVVEFAFAQLLAELLPRCVLVVAIAGRETNVARGRHQHVEHAVLGGVLRPRRHLSGFRLARLLDRDIDQVANDRVDIASDVADFGELCRFDLDERSIGEPREPARNLGLADAGRPDHQNVLRRDFGAQRLGHLLPAPAVAQRDRDRALGSILADDVLVQFVDDFSGSHHGSGAARVRDRCAVARALAANS